MSLRAALRLGVERANRRLVIGASCVIAGLTMFGGAATALRVRHVDRTSSALLTLITWVLVWGTGVLLAFGLSSRALVRDHQDGILDLFERHAFGRTAYILARTFGIACVLAAVLGAATLLSGTAIALMSFRPLESLRAVGATLGAAAYVLLFSFTMAPLALAALGGRGKAGGYVVLLFLLGIPEVIAKMTEGVLPASFHELLSFGGALSAARDSLLPYSFDIGRFLRATFVLVLVAAMGVLFLHREVARVREGES